MSNPAAADLSTAVALASSPGNPSFKALVEAIARAIREQAAQPVPLLLTTQQAWEFLGLSRAAFFRLRSSDAIPKPVAVDGVGRRYRRSDLERFAAALKPARRKPARVELTE